MHAIVWTIAMIGAVVGGVDLLLVVRLQDTAPQQAVVAAMSVGWAVVPYVIARACDELTGHNRPASSRPAAPPAKRP
jgi:hypothetical protein